MGVCLGYTTIEPVPSGATTSLIEAAATMTAARPWQYTEPLLLHVADDGRVRGWSKLFLDGTVEGEQPGVEESDYRFIVQCLARLAREFGVEWAIDLEDKDSGGVTADGLDDRAEELVKSLEDVEDLLRGGMEQFSKWADDEFAEWARGLEDPKEERDSE